MTTTPQSEALQEHKRRAHVLNARLTHDGLRVKHNHVLELLAATLGQSNWRAVVARPEQPLPSFDVAMRAAAQRATALGLHLPRASLAAAVAVSRNPLALMVPPALLHFDLPQGVPPQGSARGGYVIEVPEDIEGNATGRNLEATVPEAQRAAAQALLDEWASARLDDSSRFVDRVIPDGPYGYAKLDEDGEVVVTILPDDPPGVAGQWQTISIEDIEVGDTLRVEDASPLRVMRVMGKRNFQVSVIDHRGIPWDIRDTDLLLRLTEQR